MDAVRKDVEVLVKKELNAANRKFPLFHSEHEGFAVILEEIDEAQAELKSVKDNADAMWMAIKCNSGVEDEYARWINERAIRLACEAIQVAAMAKKFIDSMEDGKCES